MCVHVRVQITGLVQRCVIIQRDENGFGLTVSGDNPVFVQLVKEGETHSLSLSVSLFFCLSLSPSPFTQTDAHTLFLQPHLDSVFCIIDGAAMRAGVQTGDRIIKVGHKTFFFAGTESISVSNDKPAQFSLRFCFS